MKNLKKLLVSLMALVMALGLVACGGTGTDTTTAAGGDDSGFSFNDGTNDNEEIPDGRIGVTYWGTWGSDNKAYIQSVINSFNESQSTYYVTMQYVGSKDDLYAKLQVTEQSKLPALINSTTEAVGSYIYTDYIVPIQDMATGDDKQYIDRIYKNLTATWGDSEGKLLGYPMGNSMSGIFCNMDILNKIGIDPLRDIKCVEDLYDICKKIKASGLCEYPIGYEHSFRYVNYSIAIEGYQIYDQENGAAGVPETCNYNEEPVKTLCTKYLNTIKKIQDEGMCYTMGASWGNELLPAFAKGQIALQTGTIGGYGRLERAWNENNSDGINVLFIPWIPVTSAGRATGQPASGNGFYVVNNGSEDSQKGAWEFIKYFTSGDNFAGWCALTGYLPISDDTFNADVYQKYYSEHSALGIDYLMEVQRTDDGKTIHPVSAVYTETGSIGLDKMNLFLQGQDIETTLADLQAEIADSLYMWKISNE